MDVIEQIAFILTFSIY